MEAYERHIRVPRTARYRVLGDPDSVEEVWFVLHGYRQLAERFIRRFAALPGLDAGVRAVVAPEALSRFYLEGGGGEHGPGSPVGATWMTRVDREHEIRDYVEYLDRLATAVLGPEGASASTPAGTGPLDSGRRVVVVGFSQGAATASRWVVHGRIRPTELVLWSGGLATDLDMSLAAESLRGVTVRLVAGDRDEWALDRVARSVARLGAAGLAAERVEFPGGHTVLPGVLAEHWP